ncbi:unnamed protein product [Medioppia subpectinata]|uniref:Uncharacterized protein n=1 Tax=Medioppia subpectinata TaxID=1979941 RepID=A0A7R9Q664_9ACAR|nr:unnamed protein product [Medioppia subpectinata]CAG2112941.1 unnamed protein product [Medioppia subpectinata]
MQYDMKLLLHKCCTKFDCELLAKNQSRNLRIHSASLNKSSIINGINNSNNNDIQKHKYNNNDMNCSTKSDDYVCSSNTLTITYCSTIIMNYKLFVHMIYTFSIYRLFVEILVVV